MENWNLVLFSTMHPVPICSGGSWNVVRCGPNNAYNFFGDPDILKNAFSWTPVKLYRKGYKSCGISFYFSVLFEGTFVLHRCMVFFWYRGWGGGVVEEGRNCLYLIEVCCMKEYSLYCIEQVVNSCGKSWSILCLPQICSCYRNEWYSCLLVCGMQGHSTVFKLFSHFLWEDEENAILS